MYGLVIQLKKNVDFMQNMSCSLPSPEAIHAARFMQRIHAEYRHASCVMQITHTRTEERKYSAVKKTEVFSTLQSALSIELINIAHSGILRISRTL